jgi:hypothetical protein
MKLFLYYSLCTLATLDNLEIVTQPPSYSKAEQTKIPAKNRDLSDA